jgi:hypothetical protein
MVLILAAHTVPELENTLKNTSQNSKSAKFVRVGGGPLGAQVVVESGARKILERRSDDGSN